MRSRYLTTTLPYVNADPHIGNALEFVQADAYARALRLRGEEVFFTIGTDEHGQKIFQAAEKAGQDVHTYVDHYSTEFQKLGGALALSNDAFIRTTSPEHYRAAEEMWRRCDAAGDIYKKSYTGVYCVGCEAYKTEKDLVEGKCPIHPSLTPETISEENYFFRFSSYAQKLLAYLERPGVITPEWRRDEAIAFVQGGLEDFSISREKKRLTWGVPVPGDDTQVMYVWFDALTSYLSTLGWPHSAHASQGTPDLYQKFWVDGVTLQMAGKDQVRFQSLMWQAMLMSAGIKNTDHVFYHGFINSGGQRMSKSLGNVINPYDLVEKYGTDATRYILLRHVHPVEDSDITWERLDEWYTANLVNGLGNLVARVMQLAETNLTEPVARPEAHSFPDDYWKHFDDFEFNQVADQIWGRITAVDERITREKPFAVVKEDAERGRAMIGELALELYTLARLINPLMPMTSETIQAAVLANKKPENLFPRLA